MTARLKVRRYVKALRRTARYHLCDMLQLQIKPVKLRISVTNRCNSRCIMCSAWQKQDNAAPSLPGELTTEELTRLAQVNTQFFSRLDHISLTGGEPLLRHDLLEIIRVLTIGFPGTTLSLNTNGFTTARIRELVKKSLEIRHQLTVMVSLDGIGHTHNATRGMTGDVYAAVRKTIEELLAIRETGARLKIEINTVMTNVNSDQLLPVYRFCQKHKLHFNPIYTTYGQLYQNQETVGAIELSEDSRARLLQDLHVIQQEAPSLERAEIMRQLRGGMRDFDCWAGKLIFLIEENADVYPNGGCPADFCFGNLRNHEFSLPQLLSQPRARALMRRINECRLCQIPCEYLTTLKHAEAVTGLRKTPHSPMRTS